MAKAEISGSVCKNTINLESNGWVSANKSILFFIISRQRLQAACLKQLSNITQTCLYIQYYIHVSTYIHTYIYECIVIRNKYVLYNTHAPDSIAFVYNSSKKFQQPICWQFKYIQVLVCMWYIEGLHIESCQAKLPVSFIHNSWLHVAIK